MTSCNYRSYPLPRRAQQLMIGLSEALGVSEFILFGGVAIDLLMGRGCQIRDIDIGIGGKDKLIDKCKRSLELIGYEIIGDDRSYFINMTDPVAMVFAKNDHWLLDISFMDNTADVGQFDIESLYYRYPELDYIDPFGALEALENKTMKPIRGLYRENPYLLLNRVINMCAKYGMSLSDNSEHRRLIKVLKYRIGEWNTSDTFHGQMAKIACYSTVLKAILRSKDRVSFVHDLVKSGVLTETMPEIREPLASLSPQNKLSLKTVKSKGALAKFLLKIVRPNDKQRLLDRFKQLNLRTWDLEDQHLLKYKICQK